MSSHTTRLLEELQYYGLVRVVRRENGIRLYEGCARPPQLFAPAERLRLLTLRIAHILAPAPEAGLRRTLSQLRSASGALPGHKTVIADLLASGELERHVVDGIAYVWPEGWRNFALMEMPPRVRLLAPFDPVVWDRGRFAHLWGWPYRLEAYTPIAKRQFGYYSLPMFWGDRAIGWANCQAADRSFTVECHFVEPARPGRTFRRAFDTEVGRLEAMLAGGPGNGRSEKGGWRNDRSENEQ